MNERYVGPEELVDAEDSLKIFTASRCAAQAQQHLAKGPSALTILRLPANPLSSQVVDLPEPDSPTSARFTPHFGSQLAGRCNSHSALAA